MEHRTARGPPRRDETSSGRFGGVEGRPSAGQRSVSSTGSGRGTPAMESRIGMSVDALLNMSGGEEDRDRDRTEDGGRNEEKDNGEEKVVRMLSLHTQASCAALRPTPLDPISHSRFASRPDLGVNTRKRPRVNGEDDEDEDGIGYQGMTPATWKNWERLGGVKGSGYCYAYDTHGEVYRPELSFVFMIRMVIAASPRKRLSLSSIYQAIEERWPYFRQSETTWKNSIRHCLSHNAPFVNIDRSFVSGEGDDNNASGVGKEGGRGGYWTLAESVDEITRRPPTPTPSLPPPSRRHRYHSPPSPSAFAQSPPFAPAPARSSQIGAGGSYWRSHPPPRPGTGPAPAPNSNQTPRAHSQQERKQSNISPVYSPSYPAIDNQTRADQPRLESHPHGRSRHVHPKPYPHPRQAQDHQRERPIGSSSSSSSVHSTPSGSFGSFGSYGSYGSHGSTGSPMTDPLGLEMSRAFLAEEIGEVVPLSVDIVPPHFQA